MASAKALLFPSLAEGFGLPFVEALAAGTPVIASDLDAFQEIGQGAATLLPSTDLDSWSEAIISHSMAGARKPVCGFKPAQWQDHFEIVDQAITAPSLKTDVGYESSLAA